MSISLACVRIKTGSLLLDCSEATTKQDGFFGIYQKILRENGLSARAIKRKPMLAVGVWKLLKRYREHGSIARQPGSGRPIKISPQIEQIIEQQMERDDETTATQLHAPLEKLIIIV